MAESMQEKFRSIREEIGSEFQTDRGRHWSAVMGFRWIVRRVEKDEELKDQEDVVDMLLLLGWTFYRTCDTEQWEQCLRVLSRSKVVQNGGAYCAPYRTLYYTFMCYYFGKNGASEKIGKICATEGLNLPIVRVVLLSLFQKVYRGRRVRKESFLSVAREGDGETIVVSTDRAMDIVLRDGTPLYIFVDPNDPKKVLYTVERADGSDWDVLSQ